MQAIQTGSPKCASLCGFQEARGFMVPTVIKYSICLAKALALPFSTARSLGAKGP